MQAKKRWFILFGTGLSFVLLVVVFSRLDWQTFFTALHNLQWEGVLWVAILVILNISCRCLRWNWVADLPTNKFKYFWQAGTIGYLGNTIYPARAGEILRIITLHHFIPDFKLGRVFTSAVIDRTLDMLILGALLLVVIGIHGSEQFGQSLTHNIIGIFIIGCIVLALLVGFVNRLHTQAKSWTVSTKWHRFHEGYLHILEGIQAFRQGHHLVGSLFLTLCASCIDFLIFWQLMDAFGWTVPFSAAITVMVFILLGTSLPSAPGYVGIYQVACVLALRLYGIDSANAVAYSIVLQLLTFAIIGIQGTLVMVYCGLNLSKARQEASEEEDKLTVTNDW